MDHSITPDQLQTIKQWLGTGSINIFGPQFGGKDTQGRMLAEVFNGSLIGGGDIIRNRTVPEHLKKTVDKGLLVPIEDYIKTVLPYLTQPEFDGHPLILSAVGRWHGEEEGVLGITAESNHTLRAVVYLILEEKVVWERWKRHLKVGDREIRRDDSREALEVRLKEFREKTLPVIAFYRDMGILIEVDGSQKPEKVFSDIIAGLYSLVKS